LQLEYNLNPVGRTVNTHWIGGQMDARADLDMIVGKKMLFLLVV
jgi:hypothetical protein